MSTEDQRQRWKAHWQEIHELSSAWQEQGCSGQAPTYPELPDDLVGLNCGAVTRAGTPCKQKAIYGNGRCKFHGGLATGPTTEAGKEQCRINGRKGGRPRKDGAVLKDVNVSEATETEVMQPYDNPKVVPDTKVSIRVMAYLLPSNAQVSARDSVSLPPSDGKVSVRVSDSLAPTSIAAKTEVMETDKTGVSEALHGVVLGRMAGPEMSTDAHILAALEQQVIVSDKPKSWESRKVMVSAICERCTMFASNGACLAVAKGRISSMPTDGSCAGFSAF